MHTVDETDLRILRAMQSDGNLTVTEIAERAGISQSPCSRRIAILQEKGVVKGKQTLLDAKKLGFDTLVIVRIKLQGHDATLLEAFKKAVRSIPEIQIALLVLGDFDFYLRIVVRDIEHYQRLLQGKLVSLPGVREMQSSVILEVVKDSAALPF
ncbi:Lrp/AsnC family transcriptional regulator [Aminobacter aganoensis]|uniref:Lrp/AsnC family leucine-responsive transcriptional regulator/Lrp/AsnC family transcriptional regulator n=1 Tax=Aminobacter aganoensis TaxID=83264 RepID=A0A7X0KJ89_9HYPH|nr:MULTISPECIES: Lrp/AsnC family transcriptional regulator [Aminobacter]KQU65864.1 AsnC family transcriptional regulator [Aminobacter sp. DSM 101952]MBB6353068.1 Lrp/AsnC family leucine-responsive transcriptional regulator/Lrp/AsnC family transcriptional regulator [Aminobacter aganoensis]